MAAGAGAEPFEILEHTADIGLRARGKTIEELFENAAWGLAEILDVDRSSAEIVPAPESITLAPSDIEGLLVDWMNELIVRTEEGKACLAVIQIHTVSEEGLHARVQFTDCGDAPEGTELKATTYHQLSVENGPEGWQATVYFDV